MDLAILCLTAVLYVTSRQCRAESGSGMSVDVGPLLPESSLDTIEVIFRTDDVTSSLVMSSTPIMMSSSIVVPMMSSVVQLPTTLPPLVGVVSSVAPPETIPVAMATRVVSTATVQQSVSSPSLSSSPVVETSSQSPTRDDVTETETTAVDVPTTLITTTSVLAPPPSSSPPLSSSREQTSSEPPGGVFTASPVATTSPSHVPPSTSSPPLATEPHLPSPPSLLSSPSLTPSPPETPDSSDSSDDGVITAISIVVFLLLLIVAIAIVAVVIALLIARKKRRTHTYYTAGVSGNKFHHYIDVQVRTDEEMREKTPDSKDLPIFETSFVGRDSTTVFNEPLGTTLTFKGELSAALKARTKKVDPSVANGDHLHPREE